MTTPEQQPITWMHPPDSNLWVSSPALNGWAAHIWDYRLTKPEPVPHPDGTPYHWGVRPAISFDDYDQEGWAADLATAQEHAETALRELAVRPAEQNEALQAAQEFLRPLIGGAGD